MKPPLDDPLPANAVIIYDGACVLCARSIHFVAVRDRARVFRFTASASDVGRALLAYHGLDAAGGAGTLVLMEAGRAYVRSTAVIRIARRLPWPWRALALGLVVPAPLRDGAYRLVARYRYRWFGRRDACDLPSREVRSRLL